MIYILSENELKLSAKLTLILNSSVHSDSGWRFVNLTHLVSNSIFTSKRSFSSVTYSVCESTCLPCIFLSFFFFFFNHFSFMMS